MGALGGVWGGLGERVAIMGVGEGVRGCRGSVWGSVGL